MAPATTSTTSPATIHRKRRASIHHSDRPTASTSAVMLHCTSLKQGGAGASAALGSFTIRNLESVVHDRHRVRRSRPAAKSLMSVDTATVRHIARLARIAVTDGEAEALVPELNN